MRSRDSRDGSAQESRKGKKTRQRDTIERVTRYLNKIVFPKNHSMFYWFGR